MININGRSFSGHNVTINNGTVIIDGKKIDTGDDKEINIVVEGNLDKLQVDYCKSVQVKGDVGSATFTSGDLECRDVNGSVQLTSGDVNAAGDIRGNVSTISGSVKCGNIGGSVKTTSGSIKHNKV